MCARGKPLARLAALCQTTSRRCDHSYTSVNDVLYTHRHEVSRGGHKHHLGVAYIPARIRLTNIYRRVDKVIAGQCRVMQNYSDRVHCAHGVCLVSMCHLRYFSALLLLFFWGWLMGVWNGSQVVGVVTWSLRHPASHHNITHAATMCELWHT